MYRDYLARSQNLIRGAGYVRAHRVLQWLTVALVYNFLGQIRLTQGDDQAATQLFTQALTVAHRAPDRFTVLISLYNLAIGSHGRGDLSR